MSPFQADHIERQWLTVSRKCWIAPQPILQPRTQIAQRERPRRAIGEIGLREPMECSLAEHGAQPREIVIKRIKHAEPVAAAVDFQAFE